MRQSFDHSILILTLQPCCHSLCPCVPAQGRERVEDPSPAPPSLVRTISRAGVFLCLSPLGRVLEMLDTPQSTEDGTLAAKDCWIWQGIDIGRPLHLRQRSWGVAICQANEELL